MAGIRSAFATLFPARCHPSPATASQNCAENRPPPPLLIFEAPVIWPEVLHSSQKPALGKELWGQEALSAGFPQPQH